MSNSWDGTFEKTTETLESNPEGNGRGKLFGKSAELLFGRYRYRYEILNNMHSVLNTSVKVSGNARHYRSYMAIWNKSKVKKKFGG